MVTRKKHITMIVAIFILSLVTGCSYHCCKSSDTPVVEWPTVESLSKPAEKAKTEAPKVAPKKKTDVKPQEAEVKPNEPTEISPEEKIQPAKKPEEPVSKNETLPPVIATEPKGIEPIDADLLLGEEKPKIKMESSWEGEKTGTVNVLHTVKCLITNKSSKTVDSYQLKTILPEGLVYEDKTLEPKINKFEKLEAEKTNTYEFKVISEKMGVYTLKAEVLVDNAVVHTSSFVLEIKDKPKLSLKASEMKKVTLDVPFEYTITVANKSQVNLTDVVVVDVLKENVKEDPEKKTLAFVYISSNPEGAYDEQKAAVTWKLGNLDAGQEKIIQPKLTGMQKGIVVNTITATDGKNLVKEEIKLEIEVMANIGLNLKQYDTLDPVEVGEKTTYVLEVTNQGNKDATDVRVVDVIAPEAKFVEANVEGVDVPLSYKQEGDRVIFDPIDFLKPGQMVLYRITVTTVKAGDMVNNVEVQTKDFQGTVTKGEGTKVFQIKKNP